MTKYTPPSFDLVDRVVCITGGGGFLGRDFARAFVDAGARVAVIDHDLTLAESAIAEAQGTSKNTLAIEANITDPKACLLYTSPSPRDLSTSRMPSSA